MLSVLRCQVHSITFLALPLAERATLILTALTVAGVALRPPLPCPVTIRAGKAVGYQIAAHSKLATESGSVLLAPQSDQVIAAATTKGTEADNPVLKEKSASTPEAKLAIPSQQLDRGTLSITQEMVIDSKKILAEVKSEEHNKAMVIDLGGRSTRMNETEYQVFRRSKDEYGRQEEDTIFIIISKAYHRVAFPIFLLPELVEARQSKR